MSELRTYDVIMTPSSDGSWVLKSEADKVIADKDAEIAQLQALLEERNRQVGELIWELTENERRLKRALYKACANWAHTAVALFSSYVTKNRWRWMELKCLKKAEEYK